MGSDNPKRIALALQGGGAHGAFTWGVLDRLLEEPRLLVDAVSGTSAGAMNGAVLADGLEKGGRDGARQALEGFWRAISRYGSFSPYHFGFFNPLGADWSPWALWLDVLSLFLSPYQLNPANLNPLRRVLEDTIDFPRLRRSCSIRLFVSATNVRTNHLHVFPSSELTADVLLASACLPQLHHAVEVDGEHYWDGGFMGNPVLEPLVHGCEASDVVIVQVNPTRRADVPVLAQDIADRLNEITFNSSLMREMRFIAHITRMVEKGIVTHPHYERIYFHLIGAEETLANLGARSKLDTSWPLLLRLRDLGREKADVWLDENFGHLGARSTVDLGAWNPTDVEPAP